MDKTSFGDRMKGYEAAYNNIYPKRLPLILRLDGVHFHTMIKKWKCVQPFDPSLILAMQKTAQHLCESISGAQVTYTQSDEITILVRDDMTNNTEPWFGKKINKVMSVASAMASNAFNFYYHGFDSYISLDGMATFDCRGFIVPEDEVLNCFLWRQRDCEKNSKQMLARAHFSHKQLHKKNGNDLQDMLHEKGINWNDFPVPMKRGSCVVKKMVAIKTDSGPIERGKWVVDTNIPVFSKDKDYINKFTKVGE